MNIIAFRTPTRTFCASGMFFALALTIGTARAQDKTYVMKITAPTLNASPDTYARNYAAAVEKGSGGRIKAEVYPASQLGSIPRQIEGTQFGAIQGAVIPPEFFVGVDERFEVLAAPGLVSSVAQAQRLAGDPQVLKLMLGLGSDKGLRGVGLLLGEPNQIVAKTAIRHLDDLKGKKIKSLPLIFSPQPLNGSERHLWRCRSAMSYRRSSKAPSTARQAELKPSPVYISTIRLNTSR